MWCRLSHQEKFEAEMNLVPEYSVPLSFPNNFHSVLPQNTRDATIRPCSGFFFLTKSSQTTVCGWQGILTHRVAGSTWSLYTVKMWSNVVQMSVILCVSRDYSRGRSCYAFPALTFSPAQLHCSTSMECFHCSFWSSGSAAAPPPIQQLIWKASDSAGGWRQSRSATNYLPSITFFFHSRRWITVVKMKCSWLDCGQIQLINLHI